MFCFALVITKQKEGKDNRPLGGNKDDVRR